MNLYNKLGLGSVQFGLSYGITNKKGKTHEEEVRGILKKAFDNGVTVIDTASAYGNAEEVLGKNELQNFKIVSKFMPTEGKESLRSQLNVSLRKLRVPTLYAYLAHRPVELHKNLHQWNELKSVKETGMVEKIGFSLNEPLELEMLMDKGLIPDLVQVPYNYCDRRFEQWIKALKETGCEIHTRSAFLQGLFFADPNSLSEFFSDVKPIIISLHDSVKELSGSLLKYVLEKPFIDKVIVGVEDSNQLEQNIRSLKLAEALPDLKEQLPDRILMPSLWP